MIRMLGVKIIHKTRRGLKHLARPDPPAENEEKPAEAFTCPKCNREFRNTTLLTRHVNDCLDRDF